MGMDPVSIAAIAAVAIPALIGAGKMLFPPAGASSGDVSAAGARKMADMQKAASAYGAYRPDQADARMKGLDKQMSAFQGAGNMMKAMYGGSGVPPGGGYTPGGGGYTPPPYVSPDPNKTTPLPPGFNSLDDYLRWKTWADEQARKKTDTIRTDPGADPYRPTGPIISPDTIRGGGIVPGSSGTSFTGGLPPPDFTASLMGPPPPPSNPMTRSLALAGRRSS